MIGDVELRVKIVRGHYVPKFPDECEPHTPKPDLSYPGTLEWQSEMSETHVQRQCKGCGLWAIWDPKQSTQEEGTEVTRPTGCSAENAGIGGCHAPVFWTVRAADITLWSCGRHLNRVCNQMLLNGAEFMTLTAGMP